jgi:hypothetical protein
VPKEAGCRGGVVLILIGGQRRMRFLIGDIRR